MEQHMIYLDNNATTAMHEDVIEAVHQANMLYGNASSMHMAGRQAALAIEQGRQSLASLIDAEPSWIVFTSGASEANNTVFNIFKERIDIGSKRNRMVTTTIEHPSIIETVKYLKQHGYKVDECPVDHTGMVNMDAMKSLLGEDVALVSVMLGNNE
ncbi:MAG TPA: cysteine desulfurase NifS, partial [Sphaerochaeta sp.]|nr:cysteine desulfurase NifS [Sphaerochaeta sp.]